MPASTLCPQPMGPLYLPLHLDPLPGAGAVQPGDVIHPTPHACEARVLPLSYVADHDMTL